MKKIYVITRSYMSRGPSIYCSKAFTNETEAIIAMYDIVAAESNGNEKFIDSDNNTVKYSSGDDEYAFVRLKVVELELV